MRVKSRTMPSAPPDTAERVCRFCKRSNSQPNPFEFERGKYPTLRWRRPAGKVCNICPYFKETDDTYRPMSLDDLEEHLRTKPNQQQFNEGLAKYETEKISRAVRR